MSTHTPGPAEKKLIASFEQMIDEAYERMTPQEFRKAARETNRILNQAIARGKARKAKG